MANKLKAAETEMTEIRSHGVVEKAEFLAEFQLISILLNTGVEVRFPAQLAEGLAGADPADLGEIEISPAGLGLHWPRLDADLYVPALLEGVFGSRGWMAARELGARGGSARTEEKAIAARENGRKGGRPRKQAA